MVIPIAKDDDFNNPGKNREGKVFIFCGTTFQTWQISPEGHNYISEVNLHDTVKMQFYDNVWVYRYFLQILFYIYRIKISIGH